MRSMERRSSRLNRPIRFIFLFWICLEAGAAEIRFDQAVIDRSGSRDPWIKIAADISGDASTDLIVGARGGQYQPVETWENKSSAWTHLSSTKGDLPPPSSSTQQTAALILDVDRDNLSDFVIGCRQKGVSVVWYRRGAGGWTRYVIEGTTLPIEAGGTCADIDGDRDLDIVMGGDWQSNQVWWWENPYPNYHPETPWKRRFVKNSGENKHHHQLFGDFDGNGKAELAFWNQNARKLFLAQIPPDPRATEPWPCTAIYTYSGGEHEGLAKADVDGDGKTDIVGGGRWFKHEGEGRYAVHVIDDGQRFAKAAAGQLKKGGWAETVFSPGDAIGRLKWCEWSGEKWIGHDLLGFDVVHGHSLDVADFNSDGNPDIFCAEMHTPGHGKDAAMWVFLGDGNGNFKKTVIAVGYGSHESQVGDLDGDGDIDILHKPYTWSTPRIDIWLSNVGPAGTPRSDREIARGPLKVHPSNPRYFTDGSGKAIYLTGSHTWNNLVDMGPADPPPQFDVTAYLDWMRRLNHNFMRMWTWELVTWNTGGNDPASRKETVHNAAPQPWARTGPGKALDGKPKFDLEKFNQTYFDRIRSRTIAAGGRGIYVSVMLFEGWGVQFAPAGWASHPFHRDNNLNGIDGDLNGDGKGLEVYTLANPGVAALQKAYVAKVIETVNDLDNVLYEISNENHPPSTEWQYHMIDFIHEYEKGKPKQHPVGMTFQYRGGKNSTLFESPADWISPNPEGGYRDDPPPADGRKVVLNDTDHLWGIGGNQAWAWKSFLRGHNPIFMDPYEGAVLGNRFDPKFDPVRRSMGYTLKYAKRMNLAAALPHPELCSTKYCLANPGAELLVYLPTGGKTDVDLSAAPGEFSVEWFDPSNGATVKGENISGGAKRTFEAPFGGDAVLYIFSTER